MGWFLSPYFISHLFLLLLVHFPSYTFSLCNHHDSSALLQFKNSLVVNIYNDSAVQNGTKCSSFYSSKTESWKNGTDCCRWDGVTCDTMLSHVIGLDLTCSHLQGVFHPNSTILKLRHLQQLNLAFNHFFGSPLYSGIGDLFQLTHLNLSHSEIRGDIPSTISHLSKLESLDLSYLPMRLDPSTWKKLTLNATNLREVHLDEVDMSSFGESSFMNLSSSLVSLHLPFTGLQGNLTSDILCLSNLQELDLSENDHLMGQLPKSNWSTPLRYLDLSHTSFSGNIPNSIGHLKSLNRLTLSDCKFNGPVPIIVVGLSKLKYLDLSNNMLNGTIPHWIYSLPFLSYLRLSDNQLTGSIGEFSIYSLEYLDLSHNKIQGKFPDSIFKFENLTKLYLSSNDLSGTVDIHQFSKLVRLRELSLSYNNFELINSNVDYVLPNLEYLYLSSCNITSSFPKFLEGLQNLQLLDLSSNNIHGNIPKGFHEKLLHSWNNIETIDLSFNKLQGDLPIPPYGIRFFFVSNNNFTGDISSTICSASSLNILNLEYNNLTGTIPQCLGNASSLDVLNLAHNKLTGTIPQCLCNASSLSVLNLEFNNWTGTIPQCLCNASSLEVLNLAHNKLTGTIPQCLGTFLELLVLDLQMNNLQGSMPGNFFERNALFETIKLNGNRLEGPLPRSLVHCKYLEVLDLGDNNIEDTFPSYLETLQELQVLSLRSNKLRGIITCSSTKHPFPKLRIFDVSGNNFSGSLPATCFMNFKGMMNVSNSPNRSLYMEDIYYYNDSVVVIMKGQEMELKRILTAFTTIDLSNNMFEGGIPKVIGELNSLKGVNLSHNGITGTIPQSLSNLSSLEWLDLSWNQLAGDIPLTLTNLNFLSTLNLSQNHLEGIIPTGGQFNTFGNYSYEGNPMLCGVPLSKSCGKDEEQPPHSKFQDDEESGFGFGWKSVAVGYACGAVFGILFGYNLFLTGKPQWLGAFVEGVFGIRVKMANNRARANRRGMN